ncbi:MAG: glycosyltransferase family 4 protein [Cyanobacteriota bacterium]|nr:glycosyltransferase family 4 protein [Cyanobacteriota bacterium]
MTPPPVLLKLAITLAPALATWLLLQGLIPLLRQRLLDTPNARSSHRVPTPRGGGLAFVLVGCPAVPLAAVVLGQGPLPASAWLPLVCGPLALVGLLDDRLDLPAGLRYGVQVLTAVALLALAALPLPAWGLPVVLVAITAVINFVNFMDGLDGLVAGCAAVLIAAAALLLGAPWLGALVGTLLGFLLVNWSPARVFMGDVGSTFLGAVIAGLVLQLRDPALALGLLLAGLPLLGDALLCVLRRWRAGQRVFQAHRLHLFQRLHQAGWSHRRVALLYIGSTGALALALLAGGLALVVPLALVVLLVGVGLDHRVAVPFAAASPGQP